MFFGIYLSIKMKDELSQVFENIEKAKTLKL